MNVTCAADNSQCEYMTTYRSQYQTHSVIIKVLSLDINNNRKYDAGNLNMLNIRCMHEVMLFIITLKVNCFQKRSALVHKIAY